MCRSSFFPSGKCEKYKGFVCADYLTGIDVYVHAFSSQRDMNREITSALRKLSESKNSDIPASINKISAKTLDEVYFYEIDFQIDSNRHVISAQPMVSKRCRRFLLPAFCHFAFPTCHVGEQGNPRSGARLCREDCEVLKGDTCRREFDRDNEFVRVSWKVIGSNLGHAA